MTTRDPDSHPMGYRLDSLGFGPLARGMVTMSSVSRSRIFWRKSSYSSVSDQSCVETAHVGVGISVRDSKNPVGPTLVFSRSSWPGFLAAVKGSLLDS